MYLLILNWAPIPFSCYTLRVLNSNCNVSVTGWKHLALISYTHIYSFGMPGCMHAF